MAPLWLKSIGIFVSLIVILIFIVTFGNRAGEQSNTDPSFQKTRDALQQLLQIAGTNFTLSNSAVTVPPLPQGDAWLEDSEDDPFLGSEDAEIIIMEFSDFQCPFCKASFPAIREVITKYPHVKYIYRDWPVDEFHPEARRAAEAAACANKQDLFWPYHDRLFQNQGDLSDEALARYALQTGLDVDAFTRCFEKGTYAAEVEQDLQIGINLGVRGTPTWFVNGEKIEGVIPREGWEELFSIL